VQAAPATGSIISNQAEASFFDNSLGTFETVISNTTRLVVASVEGVSLLPELSIVAAASEVVILPHRLTNTGNTASVYTLVCDNLAGDDFDLLNVIVVHDLNANGVNDSGEPQISTGDTVSLAADAGMDILIVGVVPPHVTPGQNGRVLLEAVSANAATSATVTDTLSIHAGPVLSLTKRADRVAATPGELIEYTLTGTNSGAVSAGPVSVAVDGVSTTELILRDAIPLNTVFHEIINPGVSRVLYHVQGDALHEYQTVSPADPRTVDAVAYAYTDAPPGFSFQVSFSVTVSSNTASRIINQATVYYDWAGQERSLDSNQVFVGLPAPVPTIDYYADNSFSTPVTFSNAGKPLYLGVNASICNLDPASPERYSVTLTTTLSADLEIAFEVLETGSNTGEFILSDVPTRLWPSFATVTGNGIVEAGENDVVIASLVCGGATLTTAVLIDPAGVVFDSRTNQPLADATVILRGVDSGGNDFVPTVLDASGNPVSNQVVTGSDGSYEFPLVAPGNYRLDVIAPNGYTFASALPVSLLPGGRNIDSPGSFGGVFAITPTSGPVFIDIPLDSAPVSGLFIEKTASRTTAAIGESIVYSVRLSNGSGVDITDTQLIDDLPAGFAYQTGTARLDNRPLADPDGAPGSRLTFSLGAFGNNTEHTLSYRAQVRPGALRGDGINRAQAISNETASNVAKARVRIIEDVFRDEALIIGKVYTDCNRNRQQDREELGIPGVRIYLEDGTFVISDVEGKYSFAGISPRTHVLKLDPISLPAGAEMATLGNRNSGDPNSRFVDLKKGELHRADFAEGSCSADIVEQVRARRARGEVLVAELDQRLGQEFRADGESAQLVDPRTLPASGILDADGRIVDYTPLLSDPRPGPVLSNLPARPLREAPTVNLETLLPELDAELGFVDLHDGATLASQQVSVVVKGTAGATLRLLVNGKALPESRIGQKAVMATRAVEAWEYIAVKLNPGVNQLEVQQLDPYGNMRGSTSIDVIAPGKLGELFVVTPTAGAPADGHTPAVVLVRIQDDNGVRVTARTPVTLEASLGRWDVTDLDPVEPGVQAFIEGGEAIFDLLPPQEPGEAEIRVSSGVIESEARLSFLPDLRPLIAVGLIEGAVNFSRLDEDDLKPATEQDSFEDEIRELSFGDDGDMRGGIRGSLFLKGKVKGDYLLTLSYDTDKDVNDRLFRDIQPDDFYPVYGDSSIKGFDAQSSDRLYVRIDKGKSWMLYGDYTTQSNIEAVKLGNYSRSLTGLRSHYETARTAINVFAAFDDSAQQIIEIPGQGLSGPYALGETDIVVNSEKVDILTRDRNQPGLIIESKSMSRFTDYTFNAIDGTLLFRRPVPSADANLNPVSIRVTYEVDEGGEDFWVYGFDGQLRLTEAVEVGGTYVRDEKPEDQYQLYSANISVQVVEQGVLVGEIARSEPEIGAAGDAMRIEYRHRGERMEARIYAADTDEAFDNPGAAVSAGRREAGARADIKLNERSRLSGELLYTEDNATGGNRRGASVNVDRSLPYNLRVEAGVRHSRETTLPALTGSKGTPRETNSVRTELGWQPEFLPQANLFVEYEQDIADSDRKLAALGSDYQLQDRGRLYLRHEFISSLTGAYGLTEVASNNHNTVFGMDFDYMEEGQLFSEYRLRDALSGREAEAAIGLRNAWNLAKGLRLQTGFERVQPVSGDSDNTTAITGAIEYTANPLWKGSARLELGRNEQTERVLNTLGYARKLSRDWTVLARNALSIDRDRESGNRNSQERLQLGLAWRETDTNVWQALARYEFKFDKNEGADDERRVHMWSGHVNYQPTRPLTLSGRYAGKWLREEDAYYDDEFTAHLLSGRVMYDLTERWDLGLNISTLFSGGADSIQYGLGVEVGRMVTTNLWLSAGYNFFGFRDDDLSGQDETNPGAYLRVRFKFDENMFGWLQ
jgi:uncharacterized repeat protein (TIGR01451 family)